MSLVPASPISCARRPLLIFHALAGDLLMAVPMLRFLRERYGPDIPLVCGTEPEHQIIFRQVGFANLHPREFWVRDLLPGEAVAIPADWCFDVDSVLSLAADCDLFINPTQGCGTAFSTIASKLQLPSIGYHENADLKISLHDMLGHMVEQFFQFAQAIHASAYINDFAYFPHRTDAENIRAVVREEVGQGGRLVVIHADTKVDKMWPIEHWSAWLKMLWADEPETHVLLLGYPAIPIENYAVDLRLHDCRNLPLTVNYEIAAMADLFVGVDSCMLHAADLCRVPSVGIMTHGYWPANFGMRFADGECLAGANPPADISTEAVWQVYCRVRNRQWRSRAIQAWVMPDEAAG